MGRHDYPRSFRPIPTWWVVVAALAVLGLFLGVWLSGGIGLDEGADPDPPGSRVATQTVAPTVTETRENPQPTVTETIKVTEKPKPAPTVTVKVTETAKPKPAPTVTRTETRTAAPQKVPGPTVTQTVPGPTVTVQAPPAPNSGGDGGKMIVEAPNGRGCMEMEIINGIATYGPPFPC